MSDQSPSISYFEQYARNLRHQISDQALTVEAIIGFYERAILFGDNHLYTDPYLLVQLASGAQGSCFMHLDDWNVSDFNLIVGKHALDVVSMVSIPIGIAILDAVYYHINEIEGVRSSDECEFHGIAADKSLQRANKIVDLAEVKEGNKVALIGLIVDIARKVIEKKAKIRIADLAEVGTEVLGINVERDAIPLIEWADIVIMTGNTLKTQTLSELLAVARERKKRVLIYSMTGHNIAPRYLRFGANIVTSEDFPYYWYANSPCRMKIYNLKLLE